MYKVKNKRTKQEQVWTDEMLADAKLNGLISRYTIMGKMDDKRSEPPAEILKFVQELEPIADEPIEQPEEETPEPEAEKPKKTYKRKTKTDEQNG